MVFLIGSSPIFRTPSHSGSGGLLVPVQLVAPVADHVNVVASSGVIGLLFAVSEMVGGGSYTVILTVLIVDPLGD